MRHRIKMGNLFSPVTVQVPSYPGFRDAFALVVFDFDLTVTHRHTCARPSLSASEVVHRLHEYISHGSGIQFIDCVERLLANGINVAIASYGRKDVILAMMRALWGNYGRETGPFTLYNVVTPSDVGWQDGYEPTNENQNKAVMLTVLKKRFEIPLPRQILFIDDSPANIGDARQAGFATLLVSGTGGFSTTHMQIITAVPRLTLVLT